MGRMIMGAGTLYVTDQTGKSVAFPMEACEVEEVVRAITPSFTAAPWPVEPPVFATQREMSIRATVAGQSLADLGAPSRSSMGYSKKKSEGPELCYQPEATGQNRWVYAWPQHDHNEKCGKYTK